MTNWLCRTRTFPMIRCCVVDLFNPQLSVDGDHLVIILFVLQESYMECHTNVECSRCKSSKFDSILGTETYTFYVS